MEHIPSCDAIDKWNTSEPHYFSDRLKRKLEMLRFAPITVVEAPSGYGKTTAIRDYLDTQIPQGIPIYWYTSTDEAPAASYRRLCREIKKIDRNAGERLLKMELPNAATIGEATDALRSIQCMQETYLIIDNFQIIHNVLPLAFFTALFEHNSKNLHVIIITQILKRNMLAFIKVHGIMHIDIADLRLRAEDICCYYALANVNITYEDAQEVARYTDGWIIAIYLQLRAFKEKGKLFDTVGILTLMEHLVWDGLSEEKKTFLLYLSPFEIITLQQASAIMDWNTLPEYALDALICPFIRYEPAEGWYELHSILVELLVQKRRERGTAFERECLIRAGDICRGDGRTAEALDFYMQIRDYERALSLDLSRMTLETVGNKPFVELASDIADNCPADIKKRHILSILQVAWTLLMAGMKEQFNVLMDELYSMPELLKNLNLLGEWLLLSSYKSFPCLPEMTAILREAAPLFEGKCSRVILPTAPWCFGNFCLLGEFHIQPGEADREASALEEFIAIYSRLTNGHGSGADVLFRAELAYHRGDISEAEILSYKALFLAESNKQNIVQFGATLHLAEVALHKRDTAGWQHAIASMERAASFPSQDTFVSRGTLDIVRGVLLNELEDQRSIADWLKKTDIDGYSLLAPMAINAMFVHLSFLMHQKEYAKVIGIGQAIIERGSWSNPFRKTLIMLIMAVSYKAINDNRKAAAMVKNAGELLLPDGMIFPLVAYSWRLGEMVSKMIRQNYPQYTEVYNTVRERFGIGWATLRESAYIGELPADLTPREYEVAKLAAEGLRNSEIAQKLVVTESTIRTHLRTIFQKLQIDRRAKLAEKLK
jgi:LuxR family maltose regulon positive regulatory protein